MSSKVNALLMAAAFIGLTAGALMADVTYTCNFSQLGLKVRQMTEARDGNTYQQVELEGCRFKTEEEGSPELPVGEVQLLIPAAEEVYAVSVDGFQSTKIDLQYKVYPAQPPIFWDPDVEPPAFVPANARAYASASPYPEQITEITGDGYLSGYHMVNIRVNPVQYKPGLNKLELYTSIRFTVKTRAGSSSAVPVCRRSPMVQKHIDNLIIAVSANPEAVAGQSLKFNVQSSKSGKKGISTEPISVKSLPAVEGSGVDYLIITGESLKSSFQPLADWKTRQGMMTEIRTVEWIAINYSGCDLQERIRNFIKDAYSYWGTGYVLLAGDVPVIPERELFCFPVSFFMPSDMYYSDLEGNYNVNGNNKFGEGPYGFYPSRSTFVAADFVTTAVGHATIDTTGLSYLVKTADGGKTWYICTNDKRVQHSFCFLSENRGYVGGIWQEGPEKEAGIPPITLATVLYTTDGGSIWSELYRATDSKYDLVKIFALDGTPDRIWAYGNSGVATTPGLFIYSADGGATWTETTLSLVPTDMSFADINNGCLVGGNGAILRTSNGGVLWIADNSGTTADLYSVFFLDAGHGWACGEKGTILHYDGAGWSVQTEGLSENFKDIMFTDANTGIVISNGKIFRTTDGGANWNEVDNPTSYPLNALDFTNQDNGWIVGWNGLVLKTADGGITWNILTQGPMVRQGDMVDLYPDLAVGRLPVETPDQADAMISKILKYEQNPEVDYLTKFLFLGGLSGPGAIDAEQLQLDYPAGAGIPLEYTIHELYSPKDDPINPPPSPDCRWQGDEELSKTTALSNMQSGYHFIWHEDHSSEYTLGTGMGIQPLETRLINRVDVDNLNNNNNNEFSIVYSDGCDPNKFTNDCIAEHFMKKKNGGAIGFMGNSMYGNLAVWQSVKIFQTLFHSPVNRLGDAFRSMQGIGNYGYYAFNQNLLGDPGLAVWESQPKQPWVDHPITIPIGHTAFTVLVSDGTTGEPLTGALVCLQKGTEAYATGYTDANGEITFDYTPETTGDFNITVTAQNYLPYQGACTVTPASGAYVCYEGNQLNDAEESTTHGNSDGIANPGESIGMYLTLKNTGTLSTPGITSIGVTTTDPYISPSSLSIPFMASIPAGGNARSLKQGVFTVSPTCSDYRRVVFHVSVPYTSPAWTDSFVVTIMADSLSQTGHRLVELTGDGDGVIDPGERIQISNLQITNFGSGAADGATAQLATADPYLTIETGLSAVGAIAADGIATEPNGFIFSVSPSAPSGRLYEFTLTLKDRFNRQWLQSTFELVPTVAPTGLIAASTVEGVALKWTVVSGAVGYNVYRCATSGGPYAKINRHAVKQTSYYLDKDVIPQTQYYYVVTALDASANESGYSIEASFYSPLAYKTGWPVQAGTRGGDNWASALPGDIDGDGNKEVVLGTNDGNIFAWHHDGTNVKSWPKYFGASLVSVALADIDKDGITDIVAGVGDAANFKLYAWHGDGSSIFEHVVYSGVMTKTESSISISDIDKNGWMDMVISCRSTNKVYCYEWNGAINKNWENLVDGSPTGAGMGDIDGDGYSEVVVGTWSIHGKVYAWEHDGTLVPGWPFELAPSASYAVITCLPAIGDVNKDGVNEIVIEDDNKIFLIRGNGTTIISWSSGGRVWGSLSLADIDRDNDLEIIAGIQTSYGLRAWHHNGTLCWQANTGAIHSSPTAVDVNNDGKVEVFNGCDSKAVLGYKSNGQVFEGFPIPTNDNTYSSPFIADLDGNGTAELGIDMFDGKIHVWEIPGIADPTPDWPMFHHDAMSSGRYGWLNEFSGSIARDLAISGDNFFNGDVIIEPGVTLTVKPGARLLFNANSDVRNTGNYEDRCELIVKGNLIAQGTAIDSVRLGSWAVTPGAEDWAGIRVDAGGNAQLDYCVIQNALTGIETNECAPLISHSRITKCNYGIVATGGILNVQNCALVNNTTAGIHCFDLAASIKNCLIAGNNSKGSMNYEKASKDSSLAQKDSTILPGTGIYAYNCNVTLDKDTIINNFTGFGANGVISGTFTGNVVRGNVFQGFDLFGDNFNMLITNNSFDNNGGVYNWPWELAGISIGYRNLSNPSVITIERNTFADNFAGARCTKYGALSGSKLDVWLRHNDFSKGGNDVGFSMSCDVSSNAQVIGIFNNFINSNLYGVYVCNADPGLINLGDVGNDFKGDDGGNHFYGNYEYELYHKAPGTMMAEGNFWYSKDPKEIDPRIYDDDENPACGPVDFEPFYFWGELPRAAEWSNVVSIAGDVVVPANGKLEIAPGTIVRFMQNFDAANSGADTAKTELIVKGDIKFKQGPNNAPVIFESASNAPQPGDWGGIICAHADKRTATDENYGAQASDAKGAAVRNFNNVIIRHAVTGLTIGEQQHLLADNVVFADNVTGLLTGQRSIIKNGTFSGNTAAGARFTGGATGSLENSVVKSNLTGLLFANSANINCLKDTFADNGTGVICGDCASPDFRQSVFKGNNNAGVRIYDQSKPSFSPHNSFIGNKPYHIYNHSEKAINARLNYWGTSNPDTIATYIWDGADSSGYGLVDWSPLWQGDKMLSDGAQSEFQHSRSEPLIFELRQNYPNPMRTTTAISYSIPKQGKVAITIYSVTGQLVRTVMDKQQQPGRYCVTWDGACNNGQPVGSGVYFYRVETAESHCIKKLVVLR